MLQEKLTSVKNHIVRNRAKYAVAVTITVCVAVHLAQVKEMNAFLTEHNLFDKYYTPEEI